MKFSVKQAREAADRGDPFHALLHYLAVFKAAQPEDYRSLVPEFHTVLSSYFASVRCAPTDGTSQIIELCFEAVHNDPFVFNVVAEHFCSLGYFIEAMELVRSAAKLESSETEKLHTSVNLENIKSNIMDQWHWAMLNDANRNFQYSKAIERVLNGQRSLSVLDLGGGTGLLSMIAARFSDNVYYCEMDRNLGSFAQQVMHGSNIKVIMKHSTDMKADDLSGTKIDVLITETMDCAVLGEGIVPSVLDAHRRFLVEKPIVIPQKAAVFVRLVECHSFDLEHRSVINDQLFISPSVQLSGILDQSLEPYSCCYLEEQKGGFKFLSDDLSVFSVEFSSRASLEEFAAGFSKNIMLKSTRDGIAHALSASFCVTLFDGVAPLKNNVMSRSCWQQAMFPLSNPIHVRTGMTYAFSCSIRSDQFRVSYIHDPNGMLNVDEYLIAPVVLTDIDFLFLNDTLLVSFFAKAMESASHSARSIIDLTNIPTISGSLLKEGFITEKNPVQLLQKGDGLAAVIRSYGRNSCFSLKELDELTGSCPVDIALFWPISSSGALCDDALNQILDIKLASPSCYVIPSAIRVMGCLVRCPKICQRSRPCPSAYQNVDLSAVYDLSISHYYDIELSTMVNEYCSQDFELTCMSFAEEVGNGSSELPNFLRQLNRRSEVTVSVDGTVDGLLYWFSAICGNQTYSSKSPDNNARCAVYVFQRSIEATKGQRIHFQTSLFHSNLLIDLCN